MIYAADNKINGKVYVGLDKEFKEGFQDEHYKVEKTFQSDLFQRGREIAKYHGIKAIGPSFRIGQHGSGPFTDSTGFGAEIFHAARVVNVR